MITVIIAGSSREMMANRNNNGDTNKEISKLKNLMKGDEGSIDLFTAVEQQNFKIVEKHIKNGVNINEKNVHGLNSLHMAAQMGNSRMVDLLLAEGVNINLRSVCWRTALHIAAEQQYIHVAKQLLECGAKINTKNRKGDSPLHEATRRGNLDLVRLLIDHGADPNFGSTPALILALNISDVPIMNYLLEHGAKAQGRNGEGDGLLHIAIQASSSDPATRYKVVEALLAHGASINEQNTYKAATPLHLSLDRGDVELVDLLIRSGADIHAKDSLNRSILQTAVIKNLHEVVLKLLVMGANPNDYDWKHKGILANAIDLNNEQMVRTLLKYGADPTKKMAVHVAADHGYVEIMNILVDHGANINHTRKIVLTPLHRAIEFGRVPMVVYLLAKGAKITTSDLSNLPLRRAITLFNAEKTNVNFNYVVSIMIMHIALLVAQDQYVHEENMQLIRKQSSLSKCFDDSSKELMNMKNTKVKGTNVPYFDLLTKPQHALIDCLRSIPVREAIYRNDHRLLFPKYSGKLESRCLGAMF